MSTMGMKKNRRNAGRLLAAVALIALLLVPFAGAPPSASEEPVE